MEREPFSPSNPPESQPESAIQRVVGARLSEEKRQEILTAKKEAFSRQERQEWSKFEVDNTPEEQELLGFINSDTNALLQRFGRSEFDIPRSNYHLLNEEGWKAIRGETIFSGGGYSME